MGSALVDGGLLGALPLASAAVATLALAVVLPGGVACSARPVPFSPAQSAAGAQPSEEESTW